MSSLSGKSLKSSLTFLALTQVVPFVFILDEGHDAIIWDCLSDVVKVISSSPTSIFTFSVSGLSPFVASPIHLLRAASISSLLIKKFINWLTFLLDSYNLLLKKSFLLLIL